MPALPRPLFGRFCNPDDPELDDVDKECGVDEGRMVSSLEYLITGKFERRQGDTLGVVRMLYLSVEDFQASSLSDEAVDDALAQWEEDEARRRDDAVTSARANTG